MPRRPNLAVAVQDPTAPQQDSHTKNLAILRTQWRWAAFCQFFFTFFPLFALNDVSVADIEYDLVSDTRHVLPRVLQKMLYALSYDRKVSVDNWQTALRKQYNRRAPHLNPIGPEPLASFPSKEEYTERDAEKSISEQVDDKEDKDESPYASGVAISVDNPFTALGDLNSAAPSPLNEPGSTRHSSTLEDKCTPGSSNGEPSLQPKSINWFDLPMLTKLESMHTIAEWQFHNPTRLRTIMRSDDESATWRIEPIGYDSKANSYWLIGADRLWIQRAPLKLKTLKRKRPAQKISEKKTTSNFSAQKAKRLKLSPPGKPSASHPTLTHSSDRHSRAAKDQAKKRLGAQAKEMAELNRQASSTNLESRKQGSLRSATTASPPIMGTRSSARLRGSQDDEWQSIPQEWLAEVKLIGASSSFPSKTGLEKDEESVSELTELSEDDSESPVPELNGHDNEAEDEEEEQEFPQQGAVSKDFVEWETICSTLQEWEHIADRFEKATHYSEKALYKALVNDIVPVITSELREIDRKRQLEEAVVHRKRSSRIALRESEKQEVRMATMRKQEEVEKMSRARRLEARKQREEQERLKREHARDIRRREREARDETKDQLDTDEAKTRAETERAVKKRNSISPDRATRKTTSQTNGTDISSGSRTPVGEDWELACEICNRQGINLDDGTPMMSCGTCSRWQHIQCHDRADRVAGRPRRNWNSEEFICSHCRATQRVQYNNYQFPASKEVLLHDSRPFQAHASPQLNMPSGSSSVSHQDYRSSPHYLSGYNNTHPHGRSNGQQYPNSQYPSGLAGHSIVSFSHYQPSHHSFLPNAANRPPRLNVQPLYAHTNNPNNAFQTQHNYIGSQTPVWSVDPGGSAHSNATPMLPVASYISSQTDNHTIPPVHTYSNHEPQTSYTRYSTDNLSTGYKQPVPYQTASRQ